MNVLFIGNSFTYYNEMPKMFSQLLRSEGISANVEQIVNGGYRLRQYADLDTADGKTTWDRLQERDWDYVILQGQSAEAALEEENFLQSVRTLCDRVRQVGAKPVLYQTWSYQDSSEKLNTTGMSYGAFYKKIKEGYEKAAKQNNVQIAPVGDAFLMLNHPIGNLKMIRPDDFHPSLVGSYATAVCIYCSIFNHAAKDYWHPIDIPGTDVDQIWRIVRMVIEERRETAAC